MPTKTMTINDVLLKIENKLLLCVPDNESQTPIAFSKEREDNGTYVWAAYVDIKTDWTEFDLRATSKMNPQNALAQAYTKLCQELARS
jgi:hypothetical protein